MDEEDEDNWMDERVPGAQTEFREEETDISFLVQAHVEQFYSCPFSIQLPVQWCIVKFLSEIGWKL